MGFGTIMAAVFRTYAYGNAAVRDCIEYAARSFYRIHQDTFVYQTFITISEVGDDHAAAFSLLASLSRGNMSSSGVSSGIRSSNDKEELDALVQMISGPDIAISDIGTAAAERQALKVSKVSLDDKTFPLEDIIRLFVTMIASEPANYRAAKLLRLFAGILPFLDDPTSKQLLQEGVEALGVVMMKGKTGGDPAISQLHPNTEDLSLDWNGAKREYVNLAESYTRSGGSLGPAATRRTLEIVFDLLRLQPEAIGSSASSILGELAKTHLSGPKPLAFLRDIGPIFSMFIAVIDFSGVIEQITSLVSRSNYDLDPETTSLIIESYLEVSIRLLVNASRKNMAFSIPLRSHVVSLLSEAVYLHADAFAAVERHSLTPDLLASVVLPLCLSLEKPPGYERGKIYSSIWIRLLHYVMRRGGNEPKITSTSQYTAITSVLSLQIIKLIVIRAPDSISDIKGLWKHIAQHLLSTLHHGDGRFSNDRQTVQLAPRLIDWMMWSLFEMLSLHRTPLMVDFRYRVQTAIVAVNRDNIHSAPSSLGERPNTAHSPQLSGRARKPSARSPSIAIHARMPSNVTPEQRAHSRLPSFSNTPQLTLGHQGHSRMPSEHLTPLLSGHARMASGRSARPTFTDLSTRRVSQPVFDTFPSRPGMAFRFPSSEPIRSGGGGAIIHLLGAPNQVPSAAGSATSIVYPVAAARPQQAMKDVRLKTELLIEGTRRAVRVCQMVFGHEVEFEEDEPSVRVWSVQEALVSDQSCKVKECLCSQHIISEQTKVFVEQEFKEVFDPAQRAWRDTSNEDNLQGKEDFRTVLDDDSKEDGLLLQLPTLAISSP